MTTRSIWRTDKAPRMESISKKQQVMLTITTEAPSELDVRHIAVVPRYVKVPQRYPDGRR